MRTSLSQVLWAAAALVGMGCRLFEGEPTDTIGRIWASDVLTCAGWPTPAGATRPVRADSDGVVALVYGAVDRTQLGIVRLHKRDGRVAWCRSGMHDGQPGEADTSRFLALVAGNGSQVLLLDAQSGAEVWRRDVLLLTQFSGGTAHSSSDRVAVFVADGGRRFEVVAMNVGTGQVQWQRTDTTDRPFDVRARGAEVYGDTVLVYGTERLDPNGVSRRAFFYAYSAADGSPLFRRHTGDSTTNLTSRPIRTGAGFVFGNNDGLALAVDRQGRVLWSRGGARGVIGPGTTPAIGGDTGFVGSADGSVAALDLSTGTQLWRTPRGFSLQDVAACGPYVFARQELVLYRLDRRTGAQLAVAGDDPKARPNPAIGYLASNGIDAYAGGNGRVFRLRCN